MKKSLLFVTIVAVLACLFAFSVCAAEPSTSDAFGEVTLITDNDTLNSKADYGYGDGDTARVVLQVPGTDTYMTYPMYYCFGVRNDGQWGMQPVPDFTAINEATGYAFDTASIVRLEIPDYFTAVSKNYTQTNTMTSLKYIKINKNFIYIHQGAFSRLSALETVEFEENENTEVKLTIGANAFEFCTGVKELYFPQQTCTFGERAFQGCTALTTVAFGAVQELTGTASFLDCTALKTLIIPENNVLKTVSHRSFENCESLTGTYVFENVVTIDSAAFRYSATNEDTNLVMHFPNVETIGFSGDTHIFSDSGVAKLYFGDKVAKMALNNYNNCKRLTVIEIAGVAEGFSFTSYTFRDCGIQSFSVPEGVTSLPSRMFENCASLGAVYLPSTLTAIYSGGNNFATFYRCTSLYFVSEPFTSDNIPSEPDIYYFPSGLTTITDEAFDGSRLNDVVVLPEGVTSLTNGFTFEGCTSKSGKPTVVFLGDMEAVNVRTWGVSEIYFVNENDIDAASAGYTGSVPASYCHAQGNEKHLAEKSMATEATCEYPKMVASYCFCGSIVGEPVTDGVALGHNYTGEVTYDFISLTQGGTKCTVCTNNCGKPQVESLPPVYVALGYSVKTYGTDGYSFTSGYEVNVEMLQLYKSVKGVELQFGMAFNLAQSFTKDEEITLDSFQIVAPVASENNGVMFNFHTYIITYGDGTNLDKDIIVAAYVKEGDSLEFLNRGDGEVNGFDPISYNKALEMTK